MLCCNIVDIGRLGLIFHAISIDISLICYYLLTQVKVIRSKITFNHSLYIITYSIMHMLYIILYIYICRPMQQTVLINCLLFLLLFCHCVDYSLGDISMGRWFERTVGAEDTFSTWENIISEKSHQGRCTKAIEIYQ